MVIRINRDATGLGEIIINPVMAKIITGLLTAAIFSLIAYELVRDREDTAFQRLVTYQLATISNDVSQVKVLAAEIPVNQQRIENLKDRIKRLEDERK